MDAVEVECANQALCNLSGAVETNGNPSFCQSSCPDGQMFDSPEMTEKTLNM